MNIRTYHLSGAQLQGLTNNGQYYIGLPTGVTGNASLNVVVSFTNPVTGQALIDISEYQTVRIVCSIATLTGSAGGQLIFDNVYPDGPIVNPETNGYILESGIFTFTLAASNPNLFSSNIGPYISNVAGPYASRIWLIAPRITFTTVPTAATDLYLTFLGFGWKSERND